MNDFQPPITKLITASAGGDENARQQLWPLIYDELHRIAAAQMASERRAATLQPTALVHEAYQRLADGNGLDFANRTHFFVVAAKIMRQIRVDDARRRKRQKRGGGRGAASLDQLDGAADARNSDSMFGDDPAEMLALDEALTQLGREDAELAQLVEMRFHGGLTREQIAEALGIAPRTVDKRWAFARALLRQRLSGE